jgi:hypothetical protein
VTYLLARIRAWIDAHIPADPAAELSRLDRMDGLR